MTGADATSPNGAVPVAPRRRHWWTLALRIVLVAGLAAVAGAQLWPYASWSPAELTKHVRLTDDAFFYSVLARNYHQFGFMTLDGQMPTNGYQPLWMGVQLSLSTLLDQTDTAVLLCRSSWVAYVVFAALSAWLVTAGHWFSAIVRAAILAGLVVNNTAFQKLTVAGLEVPMTLAILMALLMALMRYRRVRAEPASSTRQALRIAGLGALAGLVFFGRTDLFWVAVAVGVWLVATSDRKRLTGLVYTATLGCMVGPYVICNMLAHGSPMPISGRVKLHYMNTFLPTWQAYFDSKEWHGLFTAFSTVMPEMSWDLLVGVVIAVVVALQIAIWIPPIRRRVPGPWRLVLIALGCHMLFMYGAYRELRVYTAYYFAPEIVMTVMAVGFAITRTLAELRARRLVLRVLGRVGALVLAGGLLASHTDHWLPKPTEADLYWSVRVEFAQRVGKQLGGATRIGALWPGAVAQFSGLPTVPTDGVIGSNAYFQNYVKTGREIDYLVEHDVRHIVAYLPHATMRNLMAGRIPAMWSHVGILRVWQNQHRLRVIQSDGRYRGGLWCLLEILPDRPPDRP